MKANSPAQSQKATAMPAYEEKKSAMSTSDIVNEIVNDMNDEKVISSMNV